MGISLAHIAVPAAAATMLLTLAPGAIAQEVETIPQAFDRILSSASGDFFDNRTVVGQTANLLGIGGFPEQRMERDAQAGSVAYRDLMILQNTLDPTLRVPDLTNPYSTTLLLTPNY